MANWHDYLAICVYIHRLSDIAAVVATVISIELKVGTAHSWDFSSAHADSLGDFKLGWCKEQCVKKGSALKRAER